MQGKHPPYTHTGCHAPNFNSCCCICIGGENSYEYANLDIMYITGALASKPMQKKEKSERRKKSSSRKRDLG